MPVLEKTYRIKVDDKFHLRGGLLIQDRSVAGMATDITLHRIARMRNSKSKSSCVNKETSKERRGEAEPLTGKDRGLLNYIVAQTNFVCVQTC